VAAVTSVEWLPGGREIIAALRTTGSATTQLWRVDAETGAATAMTRDLFSYTHVSVASDSGAIVATLGLGESTLWTADADRLSEPQQITIGAADAEGGVGVSWAPDSSIVYTSRASGNYDLWTLDPKTGTRRQLTSDPADDRQPSVSPDGRSIAFVSNRQGGARIWVINIDGTDPHPVSGGPTSMFPLWRPDSSAILYMAAIRDVWQVTVDGRTERSLKGQWRLSVGESENPLAPRAIAPQGLIAGFAVADAGGRSHLALAPLDGSAPLKLLDLTVSGALIPIDLVAGRQGDRSDECRRRREPLAVSDRRSTWLPIDHFHRDCSDQKLRLVGGRAAGALTRREQDGSRVVPAYGRPLIGPFGAWFATGPRRGPHATKILRTNHAIAFAPFTAGLWPPRVCSAGDPACRTVS
jgi:hypothetical protein